MFGRSGERAREEFAKRFEPDANGYLFRVNPTATPVRVTAEEFDRSCARFVRGVRLLTVAIVIGVVVGIAPLLGLAGDADSEQGRIWTWALVAGIIVVFFLGYLHLWRAPARQFGDRAPAGPTRDRDTARRLHFQRLN